MAVVKGKGQVRGICIASHRGEFTRNTRNIIWMGSTGGDGEGVQVITAVLNLWICGLCRSDPTDQVENNK